jgi:hypothetical protein
VSDSMVGVGLARVLLSPGRVSSTLVLELIFQHCLEPRHTYDRHISVQHEFILLYSIYISFPYLFIQCSVPHWPGADLYIKQFFLALALDAFSKNYCGCCVPDSV